MNYLSEKYASYSLVENPTRIHALSNINKDLNGVEIYVKRDDVMDLGLGGNKLRKLEYLLQDAIRQGADTLITTGGIQSNHARLTAIAAAKAGLGCELVLTQPVPIDIHDYNHNGNILLEKILNVPTHVVPKDGTALDIIEERKVQLIDQGKRPYVVPMGGSSAIGCLGYTNCFLEIAAQRQELGIGFDYIVVPNGSAGTYTGLFVGKQLLKDTTTHIKSYSVLWDEATARQTTLEKAREVLALLDLDTTITEADIDIDGRFRGEAYGVPTVKMWDALRLMAQLEGIFIDPVYSGKAFAGLLSDIKDGVIPNGSRVLFVLTGGTPGLFGYEKFVSDL